VLSGSDERVPCSIRVIAPPKWSFVIGFDFSTQHCENTFHPCGPWASWQWATSGTSDGSSPNPHETLPRLFSQGVLCVCSRFVSCEISGPQKDEWFVTFAVQLQRTLVCVKGWCYPLVLLHASGIKGQNITRQTTRNLYPWMSQWNREKRSKTISSALNS